MVLVCNFNGSFSGGMVEVAALGLVIVVCALAASVAGYLGGDSLSFVVGLRLSLAAVATWSSSWEGDVVGSVVCCGTWVTWQGLEVVVSGLR